MKSYLLDAFIRTYSLTVSRIQSVSSFSNNVPLPV
jgi:hypothetical protein